MKGLILLLVPTLTLGGVQEIRQDQEDAKHELVSIYRSKVAQRFCLVNPDKPYKTTYQGMPVEIPCETINGWVKRNREEVAQIE